MSVTFLIQRVLGSNEIRTGDGTDGHGMESEHLVSAATAE